MKNAAVQIVYKGKHIDMPAFSSQGNEYTLSMNFSKEADSKLILDVIELLTKETQER